MERSGRLGIGIIGAGRVGPVFGAALAGAGHAIVGISAVSTESKDRAEAMLPGVPILEIPQILERSELVILAVPESELSALVGGLATLGAWQPGQLVLHTAPSVGTAVLEPALAAGAIPIAIHPAMAFTGTSIDLVRLRESYCAVTAASVVQPIGMALVVEMGAEPILVDEKDRPAYAEAITIATSFSAAIVGQATELLTGIGMASPGQVLAPLVRSAVENALAAASPSTIDLASFSADDFGDEYP
ncbi:MAG: hypothetical protein JWR36_1305 [Glaciihabitans sp.]|jgi:predicted short-subunit dehydrogenase-like oxidoreductase (DUF2520 family)|nr:hypothetical protein [Glaciihabitans sp.]MDQ1569541.1 hypothetical protein [Actinomycetota bacterium]